MTTFKIGTIYCQNERCNTCTKSGPNFSCASFSSYEKIVIIEREKKLLHLWLDTEKKPANPPWYSNGWKTVYLADYSVLELIEEIVEINHIDPFIVIYFKSHGNMRTISLPFVRSSIEYDLLERMNQQKWDDKDWSVKRICLSERIERVRDAVSEKIQRSIPEMERENRLKLATLISFSSTILDLLVPYILDDEIEEIFMDKPNDSIYIDHGRFGRVITPVRFSSEQSKRLVTMLRKESNLHLDRRNPSLKTDISILGVPLRFSASVMPLAADGMSFEIRRARENPFDIPSLIHNETLPIEVASLLLLAINCRLNITITGRPGTGKTTLLNALDESTPKTWRKVYIEDVVESRILERHHQIRIKVNPLDEISGMTDKSTEILKTLHRSPDYLIMGEIQTAEHSHALFHAVAAGLPSIQTCHADSASSLIARWKYNHGIDDVSLALMDIIVTLERPIPGKSKRYVKEVVEVRRSEVDGVLQFKGLHTIYQKSNFSGKVDFATDGAFQNLVKSDRNLDYSMALDKLTLFIKESEMTDFVNFSDIPTMLWENGNPLSTHSDR